VFDVVLFQPEIPENTGNIIRLCANTGAVLHLVLPTGFTLGERGLKRAGLDYQKLARIVLHADWASLLAAFEGRRLFAVSTRAKQSYTAMAYRPGDAFVFGPESRGLPQNLLESFPDSRRVRLPMRPGSRSLNLANAAAAVIYEAWRQNGFDGAASTAEFDGVE
jgi:tRNA (cytidine/uridine-2'-O-)-methyltransferase